MAVDRDKLPQKREPKSADLASEVANNKPKITKEKRHDI